MTGAWHDIDGYRVAVYPLNQEASWMVSTDNWNGGDRNRDRNILVDQLTVKWGRPHPLAHLEPGSIDLVVMSTMPLPIEWDAMIIIQLKIDGKWQRFCSGWVSGWTRDQPRPGRHRLKIICDDITGRADSATLASEPWPLEDTKARIDRITAAFPFAYPPLMSKQYLDGVGPKQYGDVKIAPRDVDRHNCLDIIARTAAPGQLTVMSELATRMTYREPRGSVIQWPVVTGDGSRSQIAITTTSDPTIVVTPSQVERVPQRADRTGQVISITINYYRLGPPIEETSKTWRRKGASTGTEIVISTDAVSIYSDLADNPYIDAWANAILNESQKPTERFTESVRLVNLAPYQLAVLANASTRTYCLINITNPPETIETLQFVLGGKLTWRAGKLAAEVELIPARVYGRRPLRISDIPDIPHPDPTGIGEALAPRFIDAGNNRISSFNNYHAGALNWERNIL